MKGSGAGSVLTATTGTQGSAKRKLTAKQRAARRHERQQRLAEAHRAEVAKLRSTIAKGRYVALYKEEMLVLRVPKTAISPMERDKPARALAPTLGVQLRMRAGHVIVAQVGTEPKDSKGAPRRTVQLVRVQAGTASPAASKGMTSGMTLRQMTRQIRRGDQATAAVVAAVAQASSLSSTAQKGSPSVGPSLGTPPQNPTDLSFSFASPPHAGGASSGVASTAAAARPGGSGARGRGAPAGGAYGNDHMNGHTPASGGAAAAPAGDSPSVVAFSASPQFQSAFRDPGTAVLLDDDTLELDEGRSSGRKSRKSRDGRVSMASRASDAKARLVLAGVGKIAVTPPPGSAAAMAAAAAASSRGERRMTIGETAAADAAAAVRTAAGGAPEGSPGSLSLAVSPTGSPPTTTTTAAPQRITTIGDALAISTLPFVDPKLMALAIPLQLLELDAIATQPSGASGSGSPRPPAGGRRKGKGAAGKGKGSGAGSGAGAGTGAGTGGGAAASSDAVAEHPSGLRAGDVLLWINNVSVGRMTPEEVQRRLHPERMRKGVLLVVARPVAVIAPEHVEEGQRRFGLTSLHVAGMLSSEPGATPSPLPSPGRSVGSSSVPEGTVAASPAQ